jgi:hypothetical protein
MIFKLKNKLYIYRKRQKHFVFVFPFGVIKPLAIIAGTACSAH